MDQKVSYKLRIYWITTVWQLSVIANNVTGAEGHWSRLVGCQTTPMRMKLILLLSAGLLPLPPLGNDACELEHEGVQNSDRSHWIECSGFTCKSFIGSIIIEMRSTGNFIGGPLEIANSFYNLFARVLFYYFNPWRVIYLVWEVVH